MARESIRISGERKLVTALFADVVDSTALAESMDFEDWATLMGDVFEVMSQAVERYDGTVNQLLGDGLLALFGSPVAHEDDPERAVRAALDIQDAVASMSQGILAGGPQTRLMVRVGVNTGPVLAGSMRPGQPATALGEAVNVAARLQSVAPPGRVVISADTYRLVASVVDVLELGAVQLRGKTEPVEAYEVHGILPPARHRQLRGTASAFVGREEELARLVPVVRGIGQVPGHVVLICGEPGIGKSRLLEELRGRAQRMVPGLAWIQGRCLSYGQRQAYQLAIDVLRELVGVPPSAHPDVVAKALRERLGQLLGDDSDEPAFYLAHLLDVRLDGADERVGALRPEALPARYVDAFRAVVIAEASSRPLVIACEDVHWVDPASADLLAKLLPHVQAAPLALICTFRPEDSKPMEELLAQLRGQGGAKLVELQLEALPESAGRSLVLELLGGDAPERDVRYVTSRSEGNPLFAEELIRTLVERGVLVPEPGGWVSGEVNAGDIPETLQGLLVARIDRLHEPAKLALKVAAVIGREFPGEVLSEVMRQLDGSIDALNELAAAETAGLVVVASTQPERTFAFRHALMQEAAYESLLRHDRPRLHDLVGRTLERLFPERLGELSPVLAHHFLQAGDLRRAYTNLVDAGWHALDRYANREALGFFEQAASLDLSPGSETAPGRQLDLLLGLAESHRLTGDPAGAQQIYEHAAQIARAENDAKNLAEAALGYSRASHVWGSDETLVRLLEEALEGLGELHAPLRARVMARLAQSLYFRSEDRPRRERLSRQAVEVAGDSGDEGAVIEVLSARRALWGPEDLEGRFAADDEMVRRADRIGDLRRVVEGRGWRIVDLFELADIPAVRGELDEYEPLARRTGEPKLLRDGVMWRATLATLAGRFAEAELLTQQTRELSREAGDEAADVITISQRFFLAKWRPSQRLAELAARFRHGAEHEYAEIPAWSATTAYVHALLGRTTTAREFFDRLARRDFADIPRDTLWLYTLSHAAEANALLGDRHAAATLYDLLLPYEDRIAVVDRAISVKGSLAECLALLAHTLDRFQEAETHFERALDHHVRLESPPLLALTQARYARLLRDRGAAGDARRAETLKRDAEETAAALGLGALGDWPRV